jgi:FKBP-type peptidyl-prolyl cis-trans isomerase
LRRKRAVAFITVSLGAFLIVSQVIGAEAPLKTPKDMQSYAMGVELVRNWQRQGIDLDLDLMIKGIRDVQAGNKLLLSDSELRAAMDMFASELRMKQAQARLTAQQDNKKTGEEFLAENKTKEGVVTLPSGLQYKILKAGSGEKPKEGDTVECRYRGTHIDGTEFERSYRSEEQQTATLQVSGVIPGWREALKLMSVGSRWQLFVPSRLAYGQRGGGLIGPNETLIFEIELVSIK